MLEQIGTYQVMRKLGEGRFAHVYLAHNPFLEIDRAIKVLKQGEGLEYSLKEARRAARQLNHPHIIGVYDFGMLATGEHYLVMEYASGGSLADYVGQGSTIAHATLDKWLRQMVDALYYGHAQGIFHGDVKPSNLLLDEYGDIKLTDFGMASAPQGAGVASRPMPYMPPEQAAEGYTLTAATDIYALGVVLYELFMGVHPFMGDTPEALTEAKRTVSPQPMTEQEIPVAVQLAITAALPPNPDERPDAVVAFGREVRRALKEWEKQKAFLPLLQQAMQAMSEEQWDEAKRVLEDAQKIRPLPFVQHNLNFVVGHLTRLEAWSQYKTFAQRNRWAEAIVVLQDLLAADVPDKEKVRHTLEATEKIAAYFRQKLFTFLRTYYDQKGLIQTVCYHVDINYDNLGGATLDENLTNLVRYAERHHKMAALEAYFAQDRSDLKDEIHTLFHLAETIP
jgi:serine/threonine protein kinase